jgi:hypothetical protein
MLASNFQMHYGIGAPKKAARGVVYCVARLAHFNQLMSLAAWNELEMDVIHKLIESVPSRLSLSLRTRMIASPIYERFNRTIEFAQNIDYRSTFSESFNFTGNLRIVSHSK